MDWPFAFQNILQLAFVQQATSRTENIPSLFKRTYCPQWGQAGEE